MADREWTTIQPDLSKLLGPVNAVIAAIDGVLAALIAILNIVQVILNVIKAFLLGFLDPIRAIIEAIIAEIRNIIHDLKNLGFYLTGDMGLCKYPFDDLEGGFAAFEQRSIRRLLDRRDANRPDFTTSSGVLAVFFYLSSQDVGDLVKFILKLMKFFGMTAEVTPYPAPASIEVKYGSSTNPFGLVSYQALDVSSFNEGVPDSVTISWAIPPGKGKWGFAPAPAGFIVEVCTEPEGYAVIGRIPRDDVSSDAANPPAIFRPLTDPTSNTPLRTFSGGALFRSKEGLFTDISDDDLHAPSVQLIQDANTPPWTLNAMALEDTNANGSAFYMGTGFFSSIVPATRYTMLLLKSKLPKRYQWTSTTTTAEDPDNNTWYVRVRALGPDQAEEIESWYGKTGSGKAPLEMTMDNTAALFLLSRDLLIAAKTGLFKPGPNATGAFNFSPPSAVQVINLPTEDDAKYLQSVQAAVAMCILCRADLPKATYVPHLDYNMFGKNTVSFNSELPNSWREFCKKAYPRFRVDPRLFFKGSDPLVFRRKMKNLLGYIGRYTYELGPPPEAVKQIVIEAGEVLLTTPLTRLLFALQGGEDTLLQYLGVIGSESACDDKYGIGQNPMARTDGFDMKKYYAGMSDPSFPPVTNRPSNTYGTVLAGKFGPGRIPEFINSPSCEASREGDLPSVAWSMGQGSGDESPILYSDLDPDMGNEFNASSMQCRFFRNAVFDPTSSSQEAAQAMVDATSTIIQVAGAMLTRGVGDSEWQVVRLLGNSLLPLEELLDKIEKFLLGILDMLQGLIDKIIAYIEAIQARIYQLQALINMIRALLNALSMFALPSLSGLVLVEAGTAGIVTGLVTATNKPVDDADAYGAGVTMVAGGVPLLLLELLAAIFPPEE